MKKNRKTKWSNERFKYSDEKLEKTLKKVNTIFESSKPKIKRQANKKLSKIKKIDYKGVKFDQSDFEEISRKMYMDEINDLVVNVMVDVANNSYKYAINQLDLEEPIEHEIDEDMIREWNDSYVKGLRSAFNDNLLIQSQYLAYRVSGAFNDNIENFNKNNTKGMVLKEILNTGSIAMLLLYKSQKKKLSNAIDNAFTNIVNQSSLEAYKDNGVEKVIRVAEIDDRTCEECIELDGEIYNVEDAPDVIVHDFCRCYYEPYFE